MKKIITLMGPTGVGKTGVALELAARFPLALVSVDSALIYRNMDIGTAKPSQNTLKQYPHHLVDLISPEERYSVAEFLRDVKLAIQAIHDQGKIPLLVGGTMLYFKALLEGLADIPRVSDKIREKIRSDAAEQGLLACYVRLREVDPNTAQRLHPNDAQRILRALEVFEESGRPLSQWLQEGQEGLDPSHILQLALVPKERSFLHEQLAKRFHQMLDDGFISEVEALRRQYSLDPDLPSMRAVGYRQVWSHLAGEIDREEMIEKAIAASRQLAKRQLTWLRSWKNVHVVFAHQPDTMAELKNHIESFLCQKSAF